MNPTLLAHAAAATAALSAGLAVVATRHVIGETDALSLVFYRYLVGVLCFLPFLPRLWPRAGLTAAELGRIALFGILFFVLFPWAFNAALAINPAARGAVGLATIPIQTLLVAALFRREQMTLPKFLAVLAAFLGIAVAFGPAALAPGNGALFLGDGLMLLGVFCAAIHSVFSRPTLMRHGPLFVTALGMVLAVVALLPVMALTDRLAVPEFSTRDWLSVLFLGSVAGAVQFSLFMWALRWLPPTTTVLYLTLNPLTAMLLGVVLLGEAVTAELLIGMVLVIAGIYAGSGLHGTWRNRRVGGPAEAE